MSDTLIKPEVLDPTTGEPLIAHIVKGKHNVARAYVTGEEIVALCGTKFIPHRDHEGLPICEMCKIEFARITGSGSN